MGKVWKDFPELYEIEEAIELYAQSIGKGEELHPQIEGDNTMITEDDARKLQYSGSNTHFGNDISLLMSHKSDPNLTPNL